MTQVVRSFIRPFHTRVAALALVAAAATALPGCTKVQLEGQSSSYLIVDSIVAARGNEPRQGPGRSGFRRRDRRFGVRRPRQGHASARHEGPGIGSESVGADAANYITVTRYHVKYIRSDGRSTQGVDVPWEFDGGATVTVTEGGGELVLTLVRVQAKLDSPLKSLVNMGGGVALSTIAEITLYGKDQAGRDVSVKGAITVNFADFADPTGGGN